MTATESSVAVTVTVTVASQHPYNSHISHDKHITHQMNGHKHRKRLFKT